MRIYRAQVEAVLADIFGHPMQLVCTAAEIAPAPPPAPKKKERPPLPPLPHADKPIEVDMSQLPPDEQKNLQNAINILGDNFIEPPEERPKEPQEAPPED